MNKTGKAFLLCLLLAFLLAPVAAAAADNALTVTYYYMPG